MTLADIAADLYTGDKGAFSNPDLSGNLGGGILRRFTVAFDYDAKRMYLAPNADFGKSDPFDRSGLWLLLDGDALKVVGVAPGGPAAKAGLAPDDRISSVDGEPVAKRTLSEWRRRLAELPAGTRVSMAIAPATSGGKPGRQAQIVLADAIPAHAVVH